MRFVTATATIQEKTRLHWKVDILKIASIARVCYGHDMSIPNDNYLTSQQLIRKCIANGHESVLEHASMTVQFIIDRAMANELTRHRVASFMQESTRYVKYNQDKGLSVVCPRNIMNSQIDDVTNIIHWETSIRAAERAYRTLLRAGVRAEDARSVLPQCLATQLVITANLREWRHIFNMRCGKGAHPDLQYIMKGLLFECWEEAPCIFEDIAENYLPEAFEKV